MTSPEHSSAVVNINNFHKLKDCEESSIVDVRNAFLKLLGSKRLSSYDVTHGWCVLSTKNPKEGVINGFEGVRLVHYLVFVVYSWDLELKDFI